MTFLLESELALSAAVPPQQRCSAMALARVVEPLYVNTNSGRSCFFASRWASTRSLRPSRPDPATARPSSAASREHVV